MSETNPDILRLKDRYESIIERVHSKSLECGRNPEEIKVIAVSKFHPVELIIKSIVAGIPCYGENYVQELKEKYNYLSNQSIQQPQWHFIGHLQTNKVKYISPFVDMIHSVDSVHLAEEISRQAVKSNRTIEILIQVNTSGETNKSGCEPDKLETLAKSVLVIDNLKVTGLMTIGSFSNNMTIVRREFQLLRQLRDELVLKHCLTNFINLSMGMTGDFEIAIEEGSTMLRIGTAIFGERIYN
jgi:PLP dependent protein